MWYRRRTSHFNPRTHVGCDVPYTIKIKPETNFNPRTHVGCDSIACHRFQRACNFNPRTHVGCDAHAVHTVDLEEDISIHAPTWGATATVSVRGVSDTFQSTHPRGVRRPPTSIAWRIFHFNPRTHVGCDIAGKIRQEVFGISIHAPTWGATHGEAGGQHRPAISIHAPTWGATLL